MAKLPSDPVITEDPCSATKKIDNWVITAEEELVLKEFCGYKEGDVPHWPTVFQAQDILKKVLGFINIFDDDDEKTKVVIDKSNQITPRVGHNAPSWDDDYFTIYKPLVKKCDCGAEKTKTTHTYWCTLYKPYK